MGFFKNLFKSKAEKEKQKKMELGLKKTKSYSFDRLKELLESKRKIDDSFYNELEEILILADMGIDYTLKFLDNLKSVTKKKKFSSVDELKETIFDCFSDMYIGENNSSLNFNENGLSVFLFIGVNGSGKTTSIGKVANKLKNEGHKVLLAAGDTFRAGAIEQLKVWGERNDVPVIAKNEGADPSSVIFDAIRYAKQNGYDTLLCDTAGRLQTKINLMKELEKIYRVIGKECPGAPHETILVIDATTGQNGLSQAKVFNESCKLTGTILTKLDGTSKGGIVLAINNVLQVPVKMYGYGEKIDDIEYFDVKHYLYSLFEGVLFEEEDQDE